MYGVPHYKWNNQQTLTSTNINETIGLWNNQEEPLIFVGGTLSIRHLAVSKPSSKQGTIRIMITQVDR